MSDSYGLMASLRPADTDEVELHECGSGKKIQGIVSVCNQTEIIQEYSIAHCPVSHGDNPAGPAHWRAWKCEIEPHGPPHEYAVNMTATETVRVKSEDADAVNFMLEGIEMS